MFCAGDPLIFTECRVKGLQREFPSPSENLNARNFGSAWGHPSIADPRSPQLLKDPVGKLSELIPLHTHAALQKRMLFLLSKLRHGDTWRKVKFDTPSPEMDPIWGC